MKDKIIIILLIIFFPILIFIDFILGIINDLIDIKDKKYWW